MEPAAPTSANEREGSLARPKRPLSAFNLFYRFKRQHVTDALARGMEGREAIVALIEAAPGLERCSLGAVRDTPSDEIRGLRRHRIREDLADNLLPREEPDRSHRKGRNAMNGAMGFVEMAGVMRGSWKGCDEFAKDVFRELADEGRALYRQRMKEWNDATSRELVLRELAAKNATKQTKQSCAKQSSAKSSPKHSSAKQSFAKLTKKCIANAKAPPRVAMTDSGYQGGGIIDHSPVLMGFHSCDGGVANDIVRAESGPLRKRIKINACSPSNFQDANPGSQFFGQGESGSSNDVRNASLDCVSCSQGREPSRSLIRQVSSGSNGGSPSPHDTSADGSPAEARETSGAHQNETEEQLRARIRELEVQLHAGRLQARVRELEVQLLMRQRANEELLMRQLGVVSRSRIVGTTGCWPLLRANSQSTMSFAADDPLNKKRRFS